MSANDNIQHAKQYKVRQGFPLSSEEINDIFDGYLYDLATILVGVPTNLDDKYNLMLNALSDIEGHLDHGKYKKDYKEKDGHTPNWRHI